MRVREHREELIARVRLLDILAALALLFVVTWYWFVQVAQGSQYRALAENNRLRRIPVVAPRGLGLDRHEDLLVEEPHRATT